MAFKSQQLLREAVISVKAKIEEVFPLLCPKKEEEWIPGWICETIYSKSGYNEQGAVFKTTKPYGTELYWTTLEYDIKKRLVDFFIMAPGLYMLRYKIAVISDKDSLTLTFNQLFTAVSDEGNKFLDRYRTEDFPGRIKELESLICKAIS